MVITDRASNVARIQRIVNRVDQSGNSNVEVIPLQNATAGDLVRTINALSAGQPADAAAGLTPRVVADDRTNSVLISGDPARSGCASPRGSLTWTRRSRTAPAPMSST